MNFLDAIRTGKKVRRSGEISYFDLDPHLADGLTRSELLAEDWEVEERTIELTRTQFLEMFREGIPMRGFLDGPGAHWTHFSHQIDPEILEAMADKLFGREEIG